ncbi:KAP family P-loop NTPase fold protein [Halarcobacter sp.]|uniref:KAP family P-loop NTPase fold protein n=1 Tax=Halarcobacter sp. TaxID=2321133 RepID=UPI003A8DCDB7
MDNKGFKLKSDTKKEELADSLDREQLAEKYAKFINVLDGHHTIALDAPWGSGKSFFIDLMCEEFDNKETLYVKYNSWENDYTNEPLISLMSDIFNQFKDKEYIGIDKMKSSMSKMANVSKKGLSAITKGLVRASLGTDGGNDLIEAGKEATKIFCDDITDDLFKEVDESKKSRAEFKKELVKYTNKILEEKGKDKLVIIIDELDRCRPTFAIELLENIKHLFDIENIVFFIAVDNKQLAESIKVIYGNGFDAVTYLHRFFDFELHLQRNSLFDYFMDKINEKFNSTYGYGFVKEIQIFDLTLRDINKVVNETYLLFKLYETEDQYGDFNIRLHLLILILKYKNNEIYTFIKKTPTFNYNQFIADKVFSKLESDFIDKYLLKQYKEETRYGQQRLKDIVHDAITRIENTL